MPVLTLNLGIDFLYAKVHGWWARSAHGELLESLTRSATEENFFHQLQAHGVLNVTGPERVLEQFLLRQYERLGQLAKGMDSAFQNYIHTFQRSLERENYKTILNYRFFPERESHLSDTLVRFPSKVIRENDLLSLLDATDTEQFIRLLPSTPNKDTLADIVRQLDKDRDIMRAECAVDNLSFLEEEKAIQKLDWESRAVLQELQGCQVDHINIVTLLRNANFYQLGPQQLDYAWIEGGREIPRKLFDHLASATTPQAVIDALPTSYRRVLSGEQKERSFNALENILGCQLARRARKYFYDAVNPRRALAAYPLLLEQETVNLSRIYEGIRFNLPARDIEAMMLR